MMGLAALHLGCMAADDERRLMGYPPPPEQRLPLDRCPGGCDDGDGCTLDTCTDHGCEHSGFCVGR